MIIYSNAKRKQFTYGDLQRFTESLRQERNAITDAQDVSDMTPPSLLDALIEEQRDKLTDKGLNPDEKGLD